jgi:flagellar protein FlaG
MVERVGESVSQTVMKVNQAKEGPKSDEPMQQAAEKIVEQSVPLKEEELAKFAEQVNTFLQPTQTHVQFEYHEDLQEYYAVIVDNNSEEIIKEIPSKKILDMYAAMTEFMGLFVDKKA